MTGRTACRSRLDAELYMSLHRGTSGDLAFYASECRGAQEVLELGSGYGRVSSALAAKGLRVTGIELDAWLLARARTLSRGLPRPTRERLRFVHGDMTRFALNRRFDRVVIAHSTLFCLRSARELAACLRAARRHLVPGGVLLADTYAADGFHVRSVRASDDLELLVSVTVGASTWDIFERSVHDPKRRRFVVSYVCRRRGQRTLERTLTLHHRYLLASELERAVEAAGFDEVVLRGGFRDERFNVKNASLVIRARAPARQG